jgi:hypothetical protein
MPPASTPTNLIRTDDIKAENEDLMPIVIDYRYQGSRKDHVPIHHNTKSFKSLERSIYSTRTTYGDSQRSREFHRIVMSQERQSSYATNDSPLDYRVGLFWTFSLAFCLGFWFEFGKIIILMIPDICDFIYAIFLG